MMNREQWIEMNRAKLAALDKLVDLATAADDGTDEYMKHLLRAAGEYLAVEPRHALTAAESESAEDAVISRQNRDVLIQAMASKSAFVQTLEQEAETLSSLFTNTEPHIKRFAQMMLTMIEPLLTRARQELSDTQSQLETFDQ